jgi:hypothetical protein
MTFGDSMKTTYGSKEFYADMFSDLLADVQADEPVTSTNIVEGFLSALNDWKEYHQNQAYEYESIGERVRQALSM